MSRYWALEKFGEHPWALMRLELLSATPRATLTPLSCSPNFPSAQYLDIRTAAAWTNCFITLSTLHLILKEAKLSSLLLLDASFIFCLRNTLRYPSTIHFIYFKKSRLRSVKNWRVNSCIKRDFYFDQMQNSHMWKKNKPAIWLAYLQQATTSVNDSWLTNSSKKA